MFLSRALHAHSDCSLRKGLNRYQTNVRQPHRKLWEGEPLTDLCPNPGIENTQGYLMERKPGISSTSEDHFGSIKDFSLLQYYYFFILNKKQQKQKLNSVLQLHGAIAYYLNYVAKITCMLNYEKITNNNELFLSSRVK